MIRQYIKARRYHWNSTGPSGCDDHCIDHPCGPCNAPELRRYQSISVWLTYVRRDLKKFRRYLWLCWTALDYSQIEDVKLDGIHTWDAPDFCDAFVCSATYKGRDMTEAELERLNEDNDYVYEAVQEHLY